MLVPAKARVRSFRVQERYGLIWATLEEPRWPLPEVPEPRMRVFADGGGHSGINARAQITPLLASQSMVAAALAVSRMRPGLTWRALDGDLVAGEVNARLRPDDRWFLYFDTWRADAYRPLADAVARDLGRDLHVTLEDGEYDALDACTQAGFAVHRRESYYRIPADPAVTGLAGAVLPAELDVVSAADADITRLRLLDDALRQDVPGCQGWRWDTEQFRAETFSTFFDPATYLVAVDRASGQYAGLVRVWRNRAGPRLGLIAMLAPYRRRGAARALLGQAFAVLTVRGDTSVVGEVDDTNVAAVSLLTGLGARRYGGSVELIRRQPSRPP
jgi:ribosomal protein S18 acetylase RimI-like enzyme